MRDVQSDFYKTSMKLKRRRKGELQKAMEKYSEVTGKRETVVKWHELKAGKRNHPFAGLK